MMQLIPLTFAMRISLANAALKGLALGAVASLLVGCSAEEETPGTGTQIKTASVLTLDKNGTLAVTEGKAGDSKNVQVALKLNRAHSEAIEIDYLTNDVSASNGVDYLSATGKITIPKGELEGKLSFTVFGDNRYEVNESFEVKFTPVAGTANLTFNNRIARVEITNDDATPVIQFNSPKLTVAENVGPVELILAMDRDSDLETKVSVEYKGLATLGSDYLSESTEIVFAPGETSKIITLDIVKDDIIEGGEQIDINLLTPINGTLGENKSGFVLILGDLSLPDTGVLNAYSEGDFNSPTGDQLHPYQDNEYGLDSVNSNADDGYAGMVYTKIDKAGNALPRQSGEDACIFDANTGLTWEKKTVPVEIPNMPYNAETAYLVDPIFAHWRSESLRYFWRTKDVANSGGSLGASAPKMFDGYGGVTHPYAPQACVFPPITSALYIRPDHGCSTDHYVQLAQNMALCGFKSWRLPTINELMSIVAYEENQSTKDAFYFNDMQTPDAKLYLSDTPSAENDGSVWCLNMVEKRAQLCKKNVLHHVRLVRGNKL